MPFIFAPEIFSAVTQDECQVLASLAEGRIAVELGSHFGRSTVALASTAKLVHAIDWHLGDPHAGVTDSLGAYMKNIEKHGLREKVATYVGRFEDILPLFKPNVFDVAFIDAFHERLAVERDLSLVLPAMKPGGVLAFHDYGIPWFGVSAAVDSFVQSRGLKVELTRTLAVVRL
jgi:predicted O-methyltransferase YrrM